MDKKHCRDSLKWFLFQLTVFDTISIIDGVLVAGLYDLGGLNQDCNSNSVLKFLQNLKK